MYNYNSFLRYEYSQVTTEYRLLKFAISIKHKLTCTSNLELLNGIESQAAQSKTKLCTQIFILLARYTNVSNWQDFKFEE